MSGRQWAGKGEKEKLPGIRKARTFSCTAAAKSTPVPLSPCLLAVAPWSRIYAAVVTWWLPVETLQVH